MKIGLGRRGRVKNCYDKAIERFEKWEWNGKANVVIH
jgi:hypothetical protein